MPKKNRLDKWRLIVNLSAPEGRSVNDGIDKELASLSYVSVDDVAACHWPTGEGNSNGQNGYKAGIPQCSSSSDRQAPLGYVVARESVRGCSPPLWPQVSTLNFHSHSGCHVVGYGTKRYSPCLPLHR